ncbi:MAG: acyltransferase family protein, partial [Minisyncoccota bacterium]
MKKIYFPHIDGLRFFAFLVVLISHLSIFTGYTTKFYNPIRKLFFTHGDLGVTFFFVLSGFLITYLLLVEKKDNGEVSLKYFYIRRALRIWPVYIVVILCGFFIFPYIVNTPLALDVKISLSRLPAYIFFLGNIDLIYVGYASVITGVLWSLAVEEQFYLIWPLVFKKIKTNSIPWILGGVIIASFIYRFVHWENYEIIRYMTFSVFSDLAIGCLLAYLVFFKKGFVEFFERLPSWAI